MANPDPENSFVMDKETYSKMVAMIEQAEGDRVQAEKDLKVLKEQLGGLKSNQGAQVTDLEKANRQISNENEELRNLCCFLDESRQKSKQMAMEWQSFGRYTATVLKSEADTFECKTKALQEQLDKLHQENKELREMCLILDKSSEVAGELKTDRDHEREVSPHTLPVAELNQQERAIPHYTGLTSSNTLKDQRRAHKSSLQKLQATDPQAAITELRKRVDRLESEKLELVKSLSAAHFLGALSAQSPVMPKKQQANKPQASGGGAPSLKPAGSVQPPPEVRSILSKTTREESKETLSKKSVSLEVISSAVTLLELTRRLDAAESNGYSDPQAAAEASALRVMISIAWEKIQEQVTKQ